MEKEKRELIQFVINKIGDNICWAEAQETIKAILEKLTKMKKEEINIRIKFCDEMLEWIKEHEKVMGKEIMKKDIIVYLQARNNPK